MNLRTFVSRPESALRPSAFIEGNNLGYERQSRALTGHNLRKGKELMMITRLMMDGSPWMMTVQCNTFSRQVPLTKELAEFLGCHCEDNYPMRPQYRPETGIERYFREKEQESGEFDIKQKAVEATLRSMPFNR